jgi:integrase
MLLKQLIDAYLPKSPEVEGSQRGALLRMRGEAIGAKVADKLTPADIIAHAEFRAKTVAPCTVAADISALRGMLDYAEVGLGIEGVSSVSILKALPILKRKRLIGASGRRTQMPTPAQTQAIIAYLRGTKTDPAIIEVIDYQDKSARRVSETCRHEWGQLEGMTILCPDMKHPQMKTGHTMRLALPADAYAVIMRQPRETNNPQERIFKVSDRAVKAAFTRAAQALSLDLHLHDLRRGCLTRLLASGKTVPQVMLVGGHVDPKMLLTTYNGLTAQDYHA